MLWHLLQNNCLMSSIELNGTKITCVYWCLYPASVYQVGEAWYVYDDILIRIWWHIGTYATTYWYVYDDILVRIWRHICDVYQVCLLVRICSMCICSVCMSSSVYMVVRVSSVFIGVCIQHMTCVLSVRICVSVFAVCVLVYVNTVQYIHTHTHTHTHTHIHISAVQKKMFLWAVALK